MRVTVLLADSAQAVNGKLYVLGGGWTVVGPAPTPMALAGVIEVPWDEANRRHGLRFELVDDDGQAVSVPTPTGERPVEVSMEVEVGRPAGTKPGTPFSVPFALNLGPLPLPPGGRYAWRWTVNRETAPGWEVAFSTRPAEAAPAEPR